MAFFTEENQRGGGRRLLKGGGGSPWKRERSGGELREEIKKESTGVHEKNSCFTEERGKKPRKILRHRNAKSRPVK